MGENARWEPGDHQVAPLSVEPGHPPKAGIGLVRIWVKGEPGIYVCEPHKALKAIRHMTPPTTTQAIYAALRQVGAIVYEDPTYPTHTLE
ncbi:MAG: hypothetical protein NZM37_06985 [Sandaracinaceae bacterium]|nr:hypothetical protein [Sandaracinaceae bacterium]